MEEEGKIRKVYKEKHGRRNKEIRKEGEWRIDEKEGKIKNNKKEIEERALNE